MNFFSENNILRTADSESRRGKKGDGINAILGLLQELRNVQDKIDACADAQDLTENKQAIEAISEAINEHSEKLLEIVSGGIRSIRNKEPSSEQGLGGLDNGPVSPNLPSTPTPVM